MKTRVQKTNTYSIIAVITSVIPFLGWIASSILILLALICGIAAVAANEDKAASALVSALLAIPLSIMAACTTLYIIGSL